MCDFEEYQANFEDGVIWERERVLAWFKELFNNDNLDLVDVVMAVKEGIELEAQV
jgi:hypothetical protein